MKNILFILLFVFLFLLFFYAKLFNTSVKKNTKNFTNSIPTLLEKEFNPDISTDNWALHKLRLDKFKRSQYKGLTFFVSSENKIYYLSEEGKKVYC